MGVLSDDLNRLSGRIASARIIAKALIDGRQREQRMSVLDKLALLVERRQDFNKSLDERATALLDHYAQADQKADKAFGKHHARLEAEEHEIASVDDAIERMSNAVGNGSDASSEKPKTTGG